MKLTELLENTIPTKAKKLSLTQAFGSKGLNLIEDIGIKLIEKPSYFENIQRNAQIKPGQLKELKSLLDLKIYSDVEIFGKKVDDTEEDDYNIGPQSDAKMPKESTFIVEFSPTDNQYLVDTTGARSYIRNWAFIG